MVNACWMTTCLLNANLTFYTLLLESKSLGFFAFLPHEFETSTLTFWVLSMMPTEQQCCEDNYNMNEKRP